MTDHLPADNDGSTPDYWDGYWTAVADDEAERFAITMGDVPFLMTDAELDALDADVDRDDWEGDDWAVYYETLRSDFPPF
jgi:hypothetical protein